MSALQRRLDLFQLMIEGDPAAARALADYLRVRGEQAKAGDRHARAELEDLAYRITYRWVEQRMPVRFPYLVARGHSAASAANEAWLRILDSSPLPLDDLTSLCLRVGKMIHFALTDLVNAQRKWERCHHATICSGPAAPTAPEEALAQAEDHRSETPFSLATWAEFFERIDALPDDTRVVFECQYYHQMSRSATADLLGTSEHHVRKLLLQAKLRLGDDFPDLS